MTIFRVTCFNGVAWRPALRVNPWLLAMPMLVASLACLAGSGHAEAEQPPPGAYDCLMEPKLQIKLASPAAGVLKDVRVDRGSIVRRGDLLAELDDGVEAASAALAEIKAKSDAQISSREARRNFLERKRGRLEQLRAKGATTESTFDESDSDYLQAEQDLREAKMNKDVASREAERAKALLDQRSIYSPLDGIVVERNLWRGEYAYDQAPIMTLAQIDPLNVEVFIPVSDYPNIVAGSKATVYPAAPFAGKRSATVAVIDRVFDSRSGTFGVRLSLPNPENALPAGLRCKVVFAQAAGK